MGKMLDQWIEQYAPALNSGSAPPLATPGIAPPQARRPGPAFPGPASAPPAFQNGAGPGAFEPPPAGAPVATPAPNVAQNQPNVNKTPQKLHKKGENGDKSFRSLMKDADPKQVDAAIKAMESTGMDINQAYQQATGSPPPKGASKRELGETLMEFGLSLLAAPSGQSSAENIGQAGLSVIHGKRQRKAAAAKGREERLDKQFDRGVKLEQLALQRKQIEAQTGKKAKGTYEQYVGEDGFLYTYNESDGTGTRVTVGGKPVKPSKKVGKDAGKRYEFEVKLNRYMEVFGHTPEGQALSGGDLRKVQEKALRFANRDNPYTDAEARRDGLKMATNILKDDTDFQFAEKDEKKRMLRETAAEYKEALLPSLPDKEGSTPDASKLQEGMATPVTDENGNTSYWTVQNGEVRKVSAEELGQ